MKKISIACVLSLMVVTASAAENKDWYVGASLGLAKADSGVTNLTGDLKLDESDMGYKIYSGYDINKYISAEIFYADFGKGKLSGTNGTYKYQGLTSTFSSEVEADSSTFGASAVFHLPLHKNVIPYAKVGIHSWETTLGTIENTGTDVMYGLGIDFPLNDSFSLRTEFESYKFDSESYDLITAGLMVKF
ncbi:hypothetical protein A9Q76_07375 [Arcobacter sp. 31_11_sub10_T18]|nr:hypothetical protein A9Q76_07375 [Arcobacter sp. 31_11_sub10_T18]